MSDSTPATEAPRGAGRVAGKVALVSGAAGGIGLAIARRFAEEGAHVMLGDLDALGAEQAAAGLRDEGMAADAVELDVAEESSWRATLTSIEARFARLDILVNNAGIALPGPRVFEDITLADWRRVMRVNLDGVFLGLRSAIPVMRRRGGGAIVNIGSVAAYIGTPGGPAYGSSKGGVRSLTKQAAVLCARNGENIRVNAVHPCYVWTPMTAARATETWGAEARDRLRAMHPFGCLAEPRDVANAALFLASDEARLVNGSDLIMDGGQLAQ